MECSKTAEPSAELLAKTVGQLALAGNGLRVVDELPVDLDQRQWVGGQPAGLVDRPDRQGKFH